jgi:hypothetical protein
MLPIKMQEESFMTLKTISKGSIAIMEDTIRFVDQFLMLPPPATKWFVKVSAIYTFPS